MIFESRLPLPPVPNTDAFSYVFHQGRREYPKNRVLYRVDGTNQTLTYAQLEKKSLQFADTIRRKYDIRPNDVVGILAKDKVSVFVRPHKSVLANNR
jgi:acyl-CoA synthetase (AMP-forming)/AMP-acid ligase II